MAAGLLSVTAGLAVKKRADRITYIRNFKKGKGALIYFVAIPMYWLAYSYSGVSALNGFFTSVRKSVELVVLKYDTAPIEPLAAASPLYSFTVYFCFILVGLNALLFTMSIVNQFVWNSFCKFKARFSRRERLTVFGNNPRSHLIYKSDSTRTKVLAAKISDREALGLYMDGIVHTSPTSFDNYIGDMVSRSAERGKRAVAVINTEDEERNIELCRIFIKHISSFDEEKRNICFGALKIFVFGDPRYEAIYGDIASDSFGCISYVNKYQRIAMDFIDKYPFSSFMDGTHIDYETSLVRPGVEINAFMIGFGKTNQQIFLTSVANNQFIEMTDKGIDIKKVRYHIFDKDPAENNKNLNHTYNRYKNECPAPGAEYLTLPQEPAREHFYHLDINDTSFYNEIRKNSIGEHRVNFIIIAFGTDLENIDMAQKLVFKFREWGVENVRIFVKVRGEHKGQCLLEEDKCYVIGNEREVVYDIESIIGDSIFKMAQMRNMVYDIEWEITDSKNPVTDERVAEIKEAAYKQWYTGRSQLERDSSLYCCLSLRSKLNLMGLDYCPIDAGGKPALTEEEYLAIYAGDDMPDLTHYTAKADGKCIVYYPLTLNASRRTSLAIHEHLRWNSFMISRGMIPATLEQIKNEKKPNGKYSNGKNYAVRRHGNITTFDGLVEFRRTVAARDRRPDESLLDAEARADVIKYDYQLLDDAYWLLSRNGYKIIKKF